MSWDSKAVPSRRRQNSSAASGRSRGLSLHNRSGSKAIPGSNGANNGLGTPIKIDPKSAHTSDPFLQEFLNPVFDPAEYLNATLPALQGSRATGATLARSSSNNTATAASSSVPLAELSTEAQTLLTQLNAHTTRLTTTLSQLTEDILRSGSRLAYEVELLRGETLSLAETLSDGPLRADLERFVPVGIQNVGTSTSNQTRRASLVSTVNGGLIPPTPATATVMEDPSQPLAPITPAAAGAAQESSGEQAKDADEPPYISHLRTLTLVRSRLDAVIKTFGDAMEFVFPPSEISVSSGFLSVSAPDFPDRSSEGHVSTEDKGQQILKKIRDEISGLLNNNNNNNNTNGKMSSSSYDDKIKGVEDATKRVEQIKELSIVWKGTAEEKGRQRFVESLARMVEERHRELVREMEAQREKDALSRQREDATAAMSGASGKRDQQTGSSGDNSAATTTESRGPLGGYGFMNQWQKIRGGL